MGDDRKTLKMVDEILKSGGAGILFGRNLFQAKTRKPLFRAVEAMIHQEASLKEGKRLLTAA